MFLKFLRNKSKEIKRDGKWFFNIFWNVCVWDDWLPERVFKNWMSNAISYQSIFIFGNEKKKGSANNSKRHLIFLFSK